MESFKKIRAIDISGRLIMTCLAATIIALYSMEVIHSSILDHIMLILLFLYFFSSSVYHLLFPTYLSSEGIVRVSFHGKKTCLPWKQISSICILNDTRRSSKVSQVGRIVIVPIGCPEYDEKKWSGSQYLTIFRKEVIWIDNSKKNQQFIEKYYGKIGKQ